MGDLNLKAASGGQIALTPTNTASNYTLTLPAKTGNIITSADSGTVTQTMLATGVAGNGPAFYAYRTTTQTGISSGVWTKAQLNSTASPGFNLNSNFDASTNYRFTPTVAGYYIISGCLYLTGTGINQTSCALFRNGSLLCYGGFLESAATFASPVSATIYFDGTVNNYVELYGKANVTSGTVTFGLNEALMYLTGALVRAA